MFTNQIAAGVTAVILAFSGVALTAGDDTATVDANTTAAVTANGSTGVTAGDDHVETTADANAAADSSTGISVDIDDLTSEVEAETETEVEAEAEVEAETEADTNADAEVSTDDDTTSTTTSDDSDTTQVVEAGLTSYTVGTAGTVVMDGAVLVSVTTNPGWTVEIDESSADRVRVEFQNGGATAEFELRLDTELEISIGS